MDPEATARNLEERANRLSGRNNPRDLGIDEVVYAIAQFIKVADRSSKAADKYSRRLVFLTWVIVILTAILAAPLASQMVGWFKRRPSRPAAISQDQISPEEAYARQLMKGLSADDVISVCGKPVIDHVRDYGEYRWRILVYPHFEANFVLKEGHWQYDFMSGGNGRVLPDANMVTRPAGIKLPCQQ